jgi:hypothetical protein
MTLPRDLSLVPSDDGPRLRQTVSPELASYEHLEVVLRPGAPAGDEVVLHDGSIRIRYDEQAGELVVERAPADFSDSFVAVSRAALPLVDGVVTVEVWVDACSVEVFADGGLLALTFLSFPRTSR